MGENRIRFQQTEFWAEFKGRHGWRSVSEDFFGQKVRILCRTFRFGFLDATIAYVPMAPEKREGENLSEYVSKIGEFSRKVEKSLPKRTLCVRFDLPLDFSGVEESRKAADEIGRISRKSRIGIEKSRVDIQPPDSTFLDLSRGEDEILSGMKSKWRYNVRYAAKHGVTIRAVGAGDVDFNRDLDSFYELYKTTAERDGIGIHPLEYYRSLLEMGAGGGTKITLYIASFEENGRREDLAAIITLFQEDEAVYLYGCSGNSRRNLMPSYLVQWTAICDAKKFGSKIYDFYGIPPTGDAGHPMHGLYLFKTGFGGAQVHRPGSFDVPVSFLYGLYTKAENARAWFHKVFLKKIRRR